MARASRTGIRGLFKDGDGRFCIDLRWREPGTGEARRYREAMPAGITAAKAKDRAREILSAALAGGFDPKREEPRRLSEALDEYVTWRKANKKAAPEKTEASVKRLVASLGDIPIGDVSPFAVERFKRDRQAGGAGAATVNRDLAVLRHAFGLFVTWGWTSKAHAATVREVPNLKEPPGRVRFLSDDEEARLMGALNPRMRRVLACGLLSGMRQEEIVTLRKDAVDLKAGTITLVKTKNNKVRRIPIAPALLPVLEEALAASPETCPHVFTSRTGKPYAGTGVRTLFAVACEKAKVEDCTFHDATRHTFATRLRRRGVGLDVLMQLLGHSSLAMVMRYAHVGGDMMREAVALLPRPASPAPAGATTTEGGAAILSIK